MPVSQIKPKKSSDDTQERETESDDQPDQVSLPWVFPFKRPNFYLPRIRLTIPSPPKWFYTVVIMGVIFYIFSGGVYNSVREVVLPYTTNNEGDVQLIYTEGGSCYANVPHQYLFEGLVAAILMFIGAIGLYLQKEATKDPHDPDRAFNYQVVGLIILFIAVLILENMMNTKGCIPPPPPPR